MGKVIDKFLTKSPQWKVFLYSFVLMIVMGFTILLSYRQSLGSINPTDIIYTTVMSTVFAISITRLGYEAKENNNNT